MEVVKQRTDAVAGGGAGAGAGAGDDEDSEYENHLPTRIRSRQQRTNVRMQVNAGAGSRAWRGPRAGRASGRLGRARCGPRPPTEPPAARCFCAAVC